MEIGHKALVLDCGSGETKGMLFEAVSHDAEGYTISVAEVCKLGSLGDALAAEGGATSEAAAEFATKLAALRAEHAPRTVAIGVSAWFRAANAETLAAAAAFFDALGEGVAVLKLSTADEAKLEAAAVAHAAQRSGMGVPDVVMGSGGGSIQFTLFEDAAPAASFCIPKGFREGKGAIVTEGAAGMQAWSEAVQGMVASTMAEAGLGLQGGTAIAISACYYGACDAKIGGGELAPAVAAEDAASTFDAFTKKPTAVIRRDASKTKNWSAEAKALSNATLQRELFRTLLRPDCKVFFRRDWQLPGASSDAPTVSFRTTWSAGWFLQLLVGTAAAAEDAEDAEDEKKEQQGAAPATPAPPAAAPQKASGSGGGVGRVLLFAGLAAAVGFGLKLYLKQKSGDGETKAATH